MPLINKNIFMNYSKLNEIVEADKLNWLDNVIAYIQETIKPYTQKGLKNISQRELIVLRNSGKLEQIVLNKWQTIISINNSYKGNRNKSLEIVDFIYTAYAWDDNSIRSLEGVRNMQPYELTGMEVYKIENNYYAIDEYNDVIAYRFIT